MPEKWVEVELLEPEDPFDTATMTAVADLCGLNCVDALAESTAWQIAKDMGLAEPTAETRQLAWVIALNYRLGTE